MTKKDKQEKESQGYFDCLLGRPAADMTEWEPLAKAEYLRGWQKAEKVLGSYDD